MRVPYTNNLFISMYNIFKSPFLNELKISGRIARNEIKKLINISQEKHKLGNHSRV